jgi:hypothetical protein
MKGNGETMYLPLRFNPKMAALVTVLLLAGVATADEASPAAPLPVPQVNKLTIYNGAVPTVNYSVQNGSPHVQALAQTLQFTENELNVTNELQNLRLGIVRNEQTLDQVRTSQALGFGPLSTPGYAAGYASHDSALKRALIPQLAQESTPAMTYELINLREQVQTQLLAEQKKAITALRGAPPATPNAQPVAPAAAPLAAAQSTQLVALSPQAGPQQPVAPQYSALEQQVSAFQQQVRQRIAGIQQMQAQQLQAMGIHR